MNKEVQAIRAEIERRLLEEYSDIHDDEMRERVQGALASIIYFIDSLPDEHQVIDGNKTIEEAAEKKYPVYWKEYPKDGIARSESFYDTNAQCRDVFIAGAQWQKEQPIEFDCIGKKVKMTTQELINYYIDSECCDVAEECGF